MLRTFTTACLLLFSLVSFGQFTSPSVQLTFDLNKSTSGKSHGKATNHPTQCGVDTLGYGWQKLLVNYNQGTSTSQLRAVNISTGYRLGQFYSAPGDVTISGFKFYGWALDTTANPVTVYCEIYAAGADSLPSGTPLRADTLLIDTTFRNGVLDSISQYANFTPYTTDKPFIVVVRSTDSVRVAIVGNDYIKGDGKRDNFACGSIGGRWYRCLNLNIGGNTLDIDMMLEPFVKYKAYNEFTFDDCYDYKDSIFFKNTSSEFFYNPQYNRYQLYAKFYNPVYEQFMHQWYYGFSYQNAFHGGTKFPSPRNTDVRLVSTLQTVSGYGTNYNYCRDTTIKAVSFQPDQVDIQGDKEVCSGNKATLIGISSGQIHWYKSVTDTNAIVISPDYETPAALEKNDTVFVQAINKHCKSTRKRQIINVIETPSAPTIKDDSICLNSLANLVATSSVGSTRWYVDSTTLVSIHTGDFLQVGPLTQDTFFFAKSTNKQCTHPGRVRVRAFVSNAFAPAEPVVSNDTVVCLLGGPITLKASASNTLRWFDVAAGGTPIKTDDSVLVFNPTQRGTFYRYVDTYNGICPSSRLPIEIDVKHFPSLPSIVDQEACVGDNILVEYDNLDGNIEWYDSMTGGKRITTGTMVLFSDIVASETYYLQPFEASCYDTMRHQWSYTAIPYGKVVSSTLDTQACDLTVPTLEVNTDIGTVIWYDEDGEEINRGGSLATSPIEEDLKFSYVIDNQGCVTEPKSHKVHWRIMPDANFDYQVTWRDVTFASRLISQGDYIWEFGDGTDTSMGTDVEHHYYQDGDYDVSLMVVTPFDCIDTVTKTVTINSLSVATPTSKTLNVYPNPNNGNFVIERMSVQSDMTLQLLDATGSRIVETTIPKGVSVFPMNLKALQLAEGVYFLHALQDNDAVMYRLLVE